MTQMHSQAVQYMSEKQELMNLKMITIKRTIKRMEQYAIGQYQNNYESHFQHRSSPSRKQAPIYEPPSKPQNLYDVETNSALQVYVDPHPTSGKESETMAGDEIIELDIGGTHEMKVYRSTMCKVPASDLARFFHPASIRNKKGNNGKVFLDRDGQTFQIVVQYLRNNLKMTGLVKPNQRENFEMELEFWKLPLPNNHEYN